MQRLIWIVMIGLLLAPAVARAQSEEVIYYHTDAMGSVRATSDATGAVVARYDFAPFGEEWPQSPPTTNPDVRQYAGKEHDPETGLDYFGARYFRASSGRFITVDPKLDFDHALVNPQLWNRYGYSLNNPLKFVDPDGRNPVFIGGAIGAAVYTAWNAYVNVQRDRPWYENAGIEASKGFLVGATLGVLGPALAAPSAAVGSAGATIAGPLGTVAVSELDKAMNAGGQTIQLVTKLTQSPAPGRALSAAAGEGANALAAASRTVGNLYSAQIPVNALKLLENAGLVRTQITWMNGVQGLEYRFGPQAMEYLADHFKEVLR